MINPVSNALSNALSGMTNAAKKVDSAANNIANASNEGSTVNIDEEMIKTLAAKQEYQANAAVAARASSMQKELGKLFDETV